MTYEMLQCDWCGHEWRGCFGAKISTPDAYGRFQTKPEEVCGHCFDKVAAIRNEVKAPAQNIGPPKP